MNNKVIGAFIKKLREENNLSQEELAEALFVHRTTVTKWENGKSLPLNDTLKLISEMFNVSIDEILVGERIDKKRNISLELFKLNMKYKNIIVIFICLLLLSLVSFLSYYFFVTYNEYSIYNLHLIDDNYKYDLGFIAVYRNNTYFKIDNIFSSDNDKFELIFNDKTIFKGSFNYTYTYNIDFKRKYLNNKFMNYYDDIFKISINDVIYDISFVRLTNNRIEKQNIYYDDKEYLIDFLKKDGFVYNEEDDIYLKDNSEYKCFMSSLSNRLIVYKNDELIIDIGDLEFDSYKENIKLYCDR